MKTYLHIYEADAMSNELIIKVEPLYCADSSTDIITATDKDYTPSKGDKLYFLPGVNIPRVKLKDLSLQHGIKTTRNIEDATHIFAGKNTKDKITSGAWYYSIQTSAVRAILLDPELAMDDYYKENLTQALEFYTEDVVIIDYSAAGQLRNSELAFVKRYSYNSISRHSSVYYSVDSDHTDLFPDILTLDIYDESKLIKHINGEDAATIDATMFNQISDMFKSSDSDNHVLAMEIMANCNYIDSLLYLEMLFKDYANRMYQCHTKNHVNFKSLLSYLGKSKNNMDTSVDDIMKALINKDVLDTDKIDVLMEHYSDELGRRGNSTFFKVKSVTVNEETLQLLNTNYVYNELPDFVPEGGVEVPELHGNLDDLVGPAHVCNDAAQEEELTDEDIEDAFTNIVRDELKSELIELEEEKEFPEDESVLTEAEDYALGEIISNLAEESESNNNQKEKDATDDFEWF
jgi:hypothetical protein